MPDVMTPTRRLASRLRRVARVLRTTRHTVERVPDVIDAILVLPTLAHRLETIEAALAGMTPPLERIDVNTAGVHQLTEVMVPLRGAAVRVGRLTDRFPQRAI